MKRILISVIIILLIFEILMFPQSAMSYATTGLTLWFDNMIPALFPFMVISGLAIRLDIAPYIISLLHPFLYRIFRTNHYCEYAVIMGFLCGFPMGAVIVKDLLNTQKININQANYLLAFCNNIGPVFFCTIILPIFPKELSPFLIIGMYGIPFIYGILLRYTAYKNISFTGVRSDTNRTTNSETHFIEAFTQALNQAVSASLFLGGCMIFFNMLRFLPAIICKNNMMAESIFAWFLEVNAAIHLTGVLYIQKQEVFSLLTLPLITIGGLSCFCQTMGILQETGCNLLKYLVHKCIQCLLWLVLMSCLLLFYR